TSASGADVTGTWSGTMSLKQGDHESSQRCHMVLKQTDGTVTGTAGPDANRQSPISDGRIEGGKGIFVLSMGPRSMAFELVPGTDQMEGQVKMGTGSEAAVGTVTLKRAGS